MKVRESTLVPEDQLASRLLSFHRFLFMPALELKWDCNNIISAYAWLLE